MTDRSSAAGRFVTTVAAGAALVLAVSALEVAYRMAGRPFTPRLPDANVGFFWLLPAGFLLLLLPLITATALARAVRPGLVTADRAFFVLAVVPVLSTSLLVFRESLHDVAHLFVALGVTSALTRLVSRRPEAVMRALAILSPVLLAVPLVAYLSVTSGRVRQEAADLAALPTAPAGAPNVLLIVWDTVRAADLSLYGYAHRTTPRLEARAATGVTFDWAFSTAPWTLPSHAGMFTGHDMQDLDADWVTPLGDAPVVLSEVLAAAGYHTGGFTANRIATLRSSGLARGFHHYEDWEYEPTSQDLISHLTLATTLRRYPPFRGHWRLYPPFKDAREVSDHFLAWLDRHDRPGPFFAFLNYFNAHEAYQFPDEYRDRFPVADDLQSQYNSAIAYQDVELDRLLSVLADRGVLDDTIVILTSDHGEAFGEHGLIGHGGNLYVEQLHVPLVVWPRGGDGAGTRVATPVSNRDIAATVADLALGRRDDHPFGGRSLSRFWLGAQAGRPADGELPVALEPVPPEPVLSGVHHETSDPEAQIRFGNMTSVVLGALHYILDGRGTEELYDLQADPGETVDLATDPGRRGVLDVIRAMLAERVGPEWRPRD